MNTGNMVWLLLVFDLMPSLLSTTGMLKTINHLTRHLNQVAGSRNKRYDNSASRSLPLSSINTHCYRIPLPLTLLI
ncbi:hypothetical protein BC941DRAFT_443389 [Chlamydoabsidia padenii]|nr:hypothetical protein BC941DRAFT_443389 [Chlamydoabsidia padenii]